MKNNGLIGHIISGSLNAGLTVSVTPDHASETLKTGKFVCIYGNQFRFFSLLTDIKIDFSNKEIAQFPVSGNELLFSVLKKRDFLIILEIRPMIMIDQKGKIGPVKTVPPHFAPLYEASEQDIATIFGSEDDESKKYFSIGTPLDMNSDICIDLEKLTERSNGIFGKTGTGKTFITRLILAGLIKQNKTSLIVFDMHSEYGLQARTEHQTNHCSFVKGLKTLFPHKVALFSLDPESTRRRGTSPDVEIIIGLDSINVDDILSLQEELNLHATACEVAFLLAAQFKKEWLATLFSNGHRIAEFAESIGAHPESIAALYRKLKRVEALPFITKESTKPRESVIDQMVDYLQKGFSIIVEFGNFTQTFVYLLIANIITRRIHRLYIELTEQFLGNSQSKEPQKLMICIEEAHKFLNPQAARQTIFGTIAREMRKYYVSLLIVDQRPSSIDEEILSQIGTKIIAQLHDEKDINAVLSGIANASGLKNILTTLDSKQQALVLGYAITMPVVIQTRSYNEQFYEQIAFQKKFESLSQLVDQLY
jgi:hypothetical protein